MFLLYINEFNTNLKRICFCFGGALGGIIIVLKESSICVSCLYKQIPFIPSPVGLRSNYFGNRRYRLISRPIFLVVRFDSFIHLFHYHSVHHCVFVVNCCKLLQIAKIATYAGFADLDFRLQQHA